MSGEIKRYGYGVKYIKASANEGIGVPCVVEKPDGEFVKYEDYQALLERALEIHHANERLQLAIGLTAGIQ